MTQKRDCDSDTSVCKNGKTVVFRCILLFSSHIFDKTLNFRTGSFTFVYNFSAIVNNCYMYLLLKVCMIGLPK